MGINVLWDERYSVCNDEIDRQHRYLFELAGSLPESIDHGTYVSSVMALYRYALKHFKDEEAMMRDKKYPLAGSHTKLHDELVVRLTEIASTPIEDNEHYFIFSKFVIDWLIEHILHHDRKFMEFMQHGHSVHIHENEG